MQSTSNSFSILVPFATVNRKPRPEGASPQRPLSSIIAENQIREKNLQYQHLLICRKELEIAVEDHRNKYEALVKRRKKADRTLQDAIAKRDQTQLECKEKRCYLQRYYDELDRKFRGGREDLFSSLVRLERNLLEAYEKDQKRLRESVSSEEEQFNRLVTLVGIEQQRRNHLQEQLERMENVRQNNAYSLRKSGDNDLIELMNQNNHLINELEKLKKVKKTIENEQRVFKRILNVQEEHRKHSAIIQNGIKKMFMNKLKDQRYKAGSSSEYEKNLQGLKEILSKKKTERDAMIAEVSDKKARLEAICKENNQRNREYGELQEKLFRRQSR